MIALKNAEIKKFLDHEQMKYRERLEKICSDNIADEQGEELIKQLFTDIYSAGFDNGVKMAATIVKHAYDACVEKKE